MVRRGLFHRFFMLQTYALTMKNHTLLALPVAFGLALAACGASPEEELSNAKAHLAKNEYTEARLRLTNALKGDEDNIETLRSLAHVNMALRDGEGALTAKGRLEAAGGTLENPILFEAEANVLKGQSDAALALVDGDDRAEAARIRALALVAKGEFESAREELKAGVEGTGPKGELLADLAQFLYADGDFDGAATAAKHALNEDPEGLGPLLAAAMMAAHNDHKNEAARYYQKAHLIFPESKSALLGRIGMLGEAGEIGEARDLIAAGLVRAPEDRELVFMSARMDAEDGEWETARQKLQAIEGKLRDYPDGMLLYATALLRTGQGELGESMLEALVSRYPDHWRGRGLLVEVKLDKRNYRAAERLLRPFRGQGDLTPAEVQALIDRFEKENAAAS